MLTANAAVDAIAKRAPKEEIWNINAEESYHEETIAASRPPCLCAIVMSSDTVQSAVPFLAISPQ